MHSSTAYKLSQTSDSFLGNKLYKTQLTNIYSVVMTGWSKQHPVSVESTVTVATYPSVISINIQSTPAHSNACLPTMKEITSFLPNHT